MHLKYTCALAASLALVACGGSDTVEDPANNPEDVAEALGNLPSAEPGEYTTTGELVEFEVPGMSDDEVQMARGFMATLFSEPQTQCLTQEEADEGFENFISDMGQGNDACEMQTFESTGNSFNAEMTCDDGSGNVGEMSYAGEVSSTSMDMTMSVDGTDPDMGAMRFVVRMQSERTGDCAS